MIAVPITLVLSILVFGSLVAALLPLAVGAMSPCIGTFLVLRVVARFTDVSIFSLNLTTAMGLGLAIDYSLFIVIALPRGDGQGPLTDAAVVRTVATAGRTVAFSALDRRRIAVGAAGVPARLPAFVRLRRHRGGGDRRDRAVFMPARPARRARPEGRTTDGFRRRRAAAGRRRSGLLARAWPTR